MKKLFIVGAVVMSVIALAASHRTEQSSSATMRGYYLDTIPKKDTMKKRPKPRPDSPPSLQIISVK